MNTLLVIGNGFDLALKAKTQYNDFFESELYKPIKEYVNKHYNNPYGRIFDDIKYDKSDYIVTCWDILFCMKSMPGQVLDTSDEIRWCDVERTIYESLVSHGQTGSSYWGKVFKQLNNHYSHISNNLTNKPEIDNMVRFCINDADKWKCVTNGYDSFIKQLLNELNIFEARFGKYISEVTNSEEYQKNAVKLANGLSGRTVCYIDSFNYSGFSTDKDRIRHINGDTNNPIFGVDRRAGTVNEYCDSLFYKTSRRIYQDSYNISRFFSWDIHFDHVIVYGHSLNKMDYDYFYYIFTMLKFNTFNSQEMGTIEFLFDIYESDKEGRIRDGYSEAVYTLLEQYENDISSKNQNVLINLLRFSGKLIIREIVVEDVMNNEVEEPFLIQVLQTNNDTAQGL